MPTRSRRRSVSASICRAATPTTRTQAPWAAQMEENDLRVFDHKANSFGLDLAQIIFQKDAAPGTVGFKLKLSAGETAKWIHSRGLSGAPLTSPQAGEGTDSIDITEAFISYNAADRQGDQVRLRQVRDLSRGGGDRGKRQRRTIPGRSCSTMRSPLRTPGSRSAIRSGFSQRGRVCRERLGQQHGQQQGQDLRRECHLCSG